MINKFRGIFRWLSTFWIIEIIHEDITYPSVEHFYQAMKTIITKERIRIAKAATPGEAKRLGRKVTLRPDWENIKVKAMEHGIKLKFQNKDLRQRLIDTYPHVLIEGNTWGDRFWGICNGTGTNMLGQLLMKERGKHMKNILQIYTAQYQYSGTDRVDITVKSAQAPWSVFAPTWDMVMEYKRTHNESKYTKEYTKIIEGVFQARGKALRDLINSDRTITLVCFCRPGDFCHRVLLAQHLESVGASYLGERQR